LTLPSSCVTLPERLDQEACKGIYPAKFRCSQGLVEKLPSCICDKEDEVGAFQIFPLLHYPELRTPTVKHFCDRTRVAAVLRQVSNKVSPDPAMLSEYYAWYDQHFGRTLDACVSAQENVVDIHAWMKKQPYNQAYKKKLLDSLNPDNRNMQLKFKFGVFPKKELQFTEVPHLDKETPANKIKERQICGPPDEMKVIGNAFFNMLEGCMDANLPQYCGRANWLQITHKLQTYEEEIADGVWIEGDGSGFDMTQTSKTELPQTQFLKRAALNSQVVWKEPLCPTTFIQMLDNHETYVGEMLSRKTGYYIKYNFDGRPSGAGNTTLSNTLNMIAYNEFVMYKAGIPKQCYRIIVKGDDLLIRLSRRYLDTWRNVHSSCFTSFKHEHIHGLGQIMPTDEVKIADTLDQVTFLSSNFIPLEQPTEVDGIIYRYRMARMFERAIETLCWTTALPSSAEKWGAEKKEDVARQLCFDKGASLYTWAQGLPFFEKLAKTMMRIGRKGRWTSRNKYSDEPRVWFEVDNSIDYFKYLNAKHGITKEEIEHAERQLDLVTDIKGMIEFKWLAKAFR
jgi:hypothetical protein